MTVAVNIYGPDVITILSQKIHQGIVANLKIEIGSPRPRASVHKQRNLAAGREGAFQPCFVFFPKINSESVPDDVVFFATNVSRAGIDLLGVSLKAAVVRKSCTWDQGKNQKQGTVFRYSRHHFVPP